MTKKIRKTLPTFKVTLTEEQKDVKKQTENDLITILTGDQGTAKTFLACNIQLELLISGQVDKIILSRPTVTAGSTNLGYLQGGLGFEDGKMSPFVDPIVDQFYKLREKEEVDGMVRKGSIVITPVQHMRGHNIENSILIVDEAANLTIDEFKLICSRLCKNGRIVFTCDSRQVDIKQKTNSISHYLKYIQHLKGISVVRLLENFRHPLAIQIFDILDDVQENVLKKK